MLRGPLRHFNYNPMCIKYKGNDVTVGHIKDMTNDARDTKRQKITNDAVSIQPKLG